MRERLIGIDAGGTMTKVVLFDLQGNELGIERQPNVLLLPHAGWTERDAEKMWQAVCVSLRALLEKTKTDPKDVLAVTPSGYGGGIYMVDAEGQPVRNALVSTDTRTIPMLERWAASGLSTKVSDCIEQKMWPGQTLAILAWMKENEPSTLQSTAHILGCKDFLRLRLCGDISTDLTDAGCAGIINVTHSAIATDAFDLLGISNWLPKLPELGSGTAIAGKVSAAAARTTGLREGTPVVRGVYDVVGCALATGVQQDKQLAAVAGTFAIHSTLHTTPARNPLPTIQTPYPVGNTILATTAMPTSASNLEWFCKTLLTAETATARSSGRSIYDVCNDHVAATMSQPNDMQFFPFLLDGPRGAPAGFTGMTVATTLPDMLRAIYEGVVCAHRTDLDYLLSGPDAAKPEVMRFAGGPSRSAVWSQMFADGLGLPVETTNGSELGAKGAAMCAAVATGAYATMTAAMGAMVKLEHRYEPNPARVAAMDAKYQNYCAAISANIAVSSARQNPAAKPGGS